MQTNRKNMLMEFDISCTSNEIAPERVIIFVKQMSDKVGLRKLLDDKCDIPVQVLAVDAK
jgi:hypothetical protein